jgi:ubiquinone/menaquinone biosynthesis C-methylase UbiE
VKLNTIERAAMNNPIRAAHQHHREAAWFRRLAGGDLTGQDVLETGCGRGVGSEVILDRLQARHVTAFDLDDTMVELARKTPPSQARIPVSRRCLRHPSADRQPRHRR